jgi:predicted RNA-binding protein with EMAP domain
MKHIEELIEEICEELDGACEYAEKYIKSKAQGHSLRATKYKSMAEDELTHAGNIKDFAGQDVEEIRRVFELPHEVEEKWERAIKHYAERVAWIRYMLN